MTPSATIPMTWAEDPHHDDKNRCACCGREITAEVYQMVQASADMGDALTPYMEWSGESSGGWFPVGNTCAKKYLPGFTVTVGRNEQGD